MLFTEYAVDKHLYESFKPSNKTLVDYGDTASVYKLNDKVAVKVYGEPSEFNRLQHEFNVLCELAHLPFIVKPFALDLKRGMLFMEFIIGDTFSAYCEEDTKVFRPLLKDCTKEIKKSGYHAIDLHDDNVILERTKNIRIIDVEYYQKIENEVL